MRFFHFLLAFVLCAPFTAFAVLEIPNTQPKVDAEFWKKALDSTWQGLKKRNIEPWRNKTEGLIHRPKSETPGDAVSEAVGYGLLLAVYANDQPAFDSMYNAAKKFDLMPCKSWRINADGGVIGGGSASDADEDIAMALIFADKLVQKGKWKQTDASPNYKFDAQDGVTCIWDQGHAGLLPPGNGWGPPYNPGYFAPAWFRLFKEFDSQQDRNWDGKIDANYTLLESNPGYSLGMVPDWTDGGGNPLGNGPGYNAYLNGQAFFKDAIRILWRIANDYLWFGDARAERFLKNALRFINAKGASEPEPKTGAEVANFFQMNGELVPETDWWTEWNEGKTPRLRQEHSPLTIGMWATAAMAVGTDKDKLAFSAELKKYYEGGDYWGLAVNPDTIETAPFEVITITDTIADTITYTQFSEDTLHNEMYFDQFLAWFGASMMSGTWNNIIDNLDNPKEDDPGIVTPIRNHPAPSGHPSEGGEFFDVRGNRVAGIPKTPGVYIVRQGSQTKTMVVK
jgi:endo-1,4-beta-D-glucanase Y